MNGTIVSPAFMGQKINNFNTVFDYILYSVSVGKYKVNCGLAVFFISLVYFFKICALLKMFFLHLLA